MADLGWHVEVQCEGERLASLLAVLRDLPVPLVIDHFGLPDPGRPTLCAGATAILRKAQTHPVYIKLSAPYRLRGDDAAGYGSLYLAELGPGRLLWGSDWPWTNHEHGRSYAHCLSRLRDWVTTADGQWMILAHAPRHLYGFGESAKPAEDPCFKPAGQAGECGRREASARPCLHRAVTMPAFDIFEVLRDSESTPRVGGSKVNRLRVSGSSPSTSLQ